MIKKYNKIMIVCYVILAVCIGALAYYWVTTPHTYDQQRQAFLDDITTTMQDEYLTFATVEGSGDVRFTVDKSFLDLSNDDMKEKTKEYIVSVTKLVKKYDKVDPNTYVRVCIQTSDEKTIVKSNDKGHIEIVYKRNK